MRAEKSCANCGASHQEDAAFCEECGHRISTRKSGSQVRRLGPAAQPVQPAQWQIRVLPAALVLIIVTALLLFGLFNPMVPQALILDRQFSVSHTIVRPFQMWDNDRNGVYVGLVQDKPGQPDRFQHWIFIELFSAEDLAIARAVYNDTKGSLQYMGYNRTYSEMGYHWYAYRPDNETDFNKHEQRAFSVLESPANDAAQSALTKGPINDSCFRVPFGDYYILTSIDTKIEKPSAQPLSQQVPSEPSTSPQSSTASASSAATLFATYNSAKGLQMEVPQSWNTVRSLPVWSWPYDSYSYPKNDSESGVSLSVSAGILQPSQDQKALEQEQIAKNLDREFANVANLQTSETTLAGLPALKITFTATMGSSDGRAPLGQSVKVMQIWATKNDAYYTITYITEPSAYNKNLTSAQRIIESGRISGPPAPRSQLGGTSDSLA